jgi:hypothetical protein
MTDEFSIYKFLTGRGVKLQTAKKYGGIEWAAPKSVSADDVAPLLRAHKEKLFAYLVEIEEQAGIFEDSGVSPDDALRDAVKSVNARREADRINSQPRIIFKGDAELIKSVATHPVFRKIESFFLGRGGATLEVLKIA